MRAVKIIALILLFIIIPFITLASEKDPRCSPGACFLAGNTGNIIIGDAITRTDFTDVVQAVSYFKEKNINRIIIWLNSPGGSVFDAFSIAHVLLEAQRDGFIVEIRCYGLAASAAVMILVSGTKGYRYLSSSSFVMVHELAVFKFLEVQSLSSIEKEAKVMSMIQNTIVSFISKRTGIPFEELMRKAKEETWIPAREAVKLGFADKILDDQP